VVLVLITLLLALPVRADFLQIARGLDARLGTRTWIPFLGLGRVLVQAVHPNGVHDFQLAVFEGHSRHVEPLELEELMRKGVGEGFAPLVRVRSNRSDEAVFVYARSHGRWIELMILVHERDETVLVRIDANAEVVARQFGEPLRIARMADR
jgi:hypothetical protein